MAFEMSDLYAMLFSQFLQKFFYITKVKFCALWK